MARCEVMRLDFVGPELNCAQIEFRNFYQLKVAHLFLYFFLFNSELTNNQQKIRCQISQSK